MISKIKNYWTDLNKNLSPVDNFISPERQAIRGRGNECGKAAGKRDL